MLPVNPAFPGKWYARVNMKCSGFWSNLRILQAHSTPPRVPKAAAPQHPNTPTSQHPNIPTPQHPKHSNLPTPPRGPSAATSQHPNIPTPQHPKHPNLPTPPRGPSAAAPLHPNAATPQHSSMPGYSFTNSTRRFLARPSSVELSATGLFWPRPLALNRLPSMPISTRRATTA